MLRIFVDSGSSIKEDEKERYGVEIAPLRYMMGEKEYRDGIDLTMDEFYDMLIGQKLFPKTSLPNLAEVEEKVNNFTANGDEVIFLCISSGISGTYSAFKTLFADNDKVFVVDTLSAVGGIRILVEEINKYRDQPASEVVKKVEALIPRIRIIAIPETLNYLMKGGRLSKKDWLLGSILNIKPLIAIVNGSVKAVAKKMGLKAAMVYLANTLKEMNCDENYPIVAAYTYNKDNVDKLVALTNEKYLKQIEIYDNLDPVIACHWGPNAFGYIFVSKE